MSIPLREQLLRYAIEQQGVQPEYLWAGHPNFAVLRRAGSRKWYALFMDVERKRLGLPGEGIADILDVKCDPLLRGSLLESAGFLPAYHMNKDRWITLLLDGSIPWDEIITLLNMSYELTK